MFRGLRNWLRDEQGFTLVELMVVIVILGILAGIGIPTYRNFVNRAYEAEVEVAARTLKLGLELYRMEPDKDGYPTETVVRGWIEDDAANAYVSDWPDKVTLESYSTLEDGGEFTLEHSTSRKTYEYTFGAKSPADSQKGKNGE
jgi:prepilin-type N-terminal cleavage/methylation domain-containing protein